ncbi:hypothetical protein OHT59_04105 [Streptomyces sp. NBC_00243]|uniref:hypothetical protein n=1 Tax=Streptomyces sp. NBC_00243 TaxID=2975688 RepID=UPI002DDC44F8|nr:hypothetical protein [Streptomyces sp. NBC_00243]WRZ17724.1 hypothetical protein OHT59_04105 [Streptomyces sp. NBC_00243]
MRTRITIATVTAALAVALVGCSSDETSDDAAKTTPSATASEVTPDQPSATATRVGIPPVPTGADREVLLRALAAANPDTVKYEDKAIDAARNQCSAVESDKADWLASQRFTYKDVTTTEAQGKQINAALEGLGFCKV